MRQTPRLGMLLSGAACLTLAIPATAQAVEIHQHSYFNQGPMVREVVRVVHVAPPDADDDGLANRDDECPKQSGTDSGCPATVAVDSPASIAPPPVGTTVAPSSVASGTVQCESGGDYAANTGNGYTGGYQFDSQTWDAYGDSDYTEAYQAPPAVQDAAAASVPYDAWPNCP